MEKSKKNYKPRLNWDAKAENALIEIWKLNNEALRSARKNNHIYAEMAAELQQTCGIAATAADIKNKLSNMTAKYKKEKLKVGPSGGARSDWVLFEAVQEVIGSAKSVNTEALVVESVTVSDNQCMEEEYLEECMLECHSFLAPSAVEEVVPPPASPAPRAASPAASSTASSRAAKQNKKHHSQRAKSLQNTDAAITVLVEEIKAGRRLEEERSQSFQNCIEKMCNAMTDFLNRQT